MQIMLDANIVISAILFPNSIVAEAVKHIVTITKRPKIVKPRKYVDEYMQTNPRN